MAAMRLPYKSFRDLRLSSPNHEQCHQRRCGTNDCPECERYGCAHEMRNNAGFEAAKWNHRAEHERPDAHDASAHFVRHDGLQHSIGS